MAEESNNSPEAAQMALSQLARSLRYSGFILRTLLSSRRKPSDLPDTVEPQDGFDIKTRNTKVADDV